MGTTLEGGNILCIIEEEESSENLSDLLKTKELEIEGAILTFLRPKSFLFPQVNNYSRVVVLTPTFGIPFVFFIIEINYKMRWGWPEGEKGII